MFDKIAEAVGWDLVRVGHLNQINLDLFGDQNDIQDFDEFGGYIFGTLQQSLEMEMVMVLRRTYDKPSKNPDLDVMSIKKMIEVGRQAVSSPVDLQMLNQIKSDLDQVLLKYQHVDTWINKGIAHRDYQVGTGKPLPTVLRGEIRALLKDLQSIHDRTCVVVQKSTTHWPGLSPYAYKPDQFKRRVKFGKTLA